MNDHKVCARRIGLRPMTVAIYSLLLAAASSFLLWTMSPSFESPVSLMASAATKPDKSGKKSEPVDKTAPQESQQTKESSDPATGPRTHELDTRTVKLNYLSTPWEKVLLDLANATDSELVADRVPRGRFSRSDKAKYSRHDAVRILNKEMEPLGFRLIEKGDFLIVLDIPSLRPRYQPAVLPPRQPADQPATAAESPVPITASVQSISPRQDPPAETSKPAPGKPASRNAKSITRRHIQQASHEEQTSEEPSPVPAALDEDPFANASQVIFRPRHRSAIDISRQLVRMFKPRTQLMTTGRNQLPAFRITTPGVAATEGEAPRRPSVVTISIDEISEELLIDAATREADGMMKLLRTLDRPIDATDHVQVTTSTRFVCQVANQLPAEIARLRAARQGQAAARGGIRPADWVADQEMAQAGDPVDQAAPGLMGRAIGDQLGNLKGEVTIEAIEDLAALILKGNQKDVEQVMRVIRELEKLSEATAPKLHLLYLKHVDSESIAELLTSVYERLQKFPGRATQPRQSAAILPITKPNALLIIAPETDLNSILELAEELDHPVDPTTEFQVFGLKSAIAAQVEELILQFYAERKNMGVKVLVIADTRSNAVIVRAQARDLEEIGALIRQIDRDDAGAVTRLKIFTLKNALATELAAVINAAIQSVIAPPTSGAGGGGGGGGAAAGGFGGGNQLGLNTAQIDEQFRNVKSAVLRFLIVDSQGERDIRSGILADIRITPDVRVNTLIVSASEASMPLIEALILQLDRPTTTVSEIKVFTLANADAEMMVQQLNALFNNQPQGQGGIGGNLQRQMGIALEGAADSSSSLVPLKFSVDKRTNSVIAVGAREALGVVEAILLKLDESDLRARQNVVIRLQNSQATLIAQSVQQFYQNQRDIAQSADPNLVSSVEQLEKEVVVVPDATNNSLLLSATPRYFKSIENMILKLDAQPRQVIIQAMLIEVELDNTDEFGIELGFQDPTLFKRSPVSNLQTFSTTTSQTQTSTVASNELLSLDGSPGFNFNNPSLPLGNNVSTQASNPAIVAPQALTNFNLGRVNSTLGFGGLVLSAGSDAVNVLIRALSAHHKINVLSRPQIRALDNQMAEVFSGQQIPIITGFTANGTTGVNTPTVQQQMAGIQLQVMPRITADGNVVMQLYAQRSQYQQQGVPLSTDATGRTVSSPILNISRLNTTISVPTGNTVVIGGLIQSYDEAITNKAPFLADIPLLGNLFRYDSRTTRRVELLMVLTPRVLRGGIEEEMIKEVELGRIHYIEAEVEDMHGPLMALPCPEDVFNDPNQPSPQGMYPQPNTIPNLSPNLSPQPVAPPPQPGIDPSTPPPPMPNPDASSAKSVIRDPSVDSVGVARLRFTEEDAAPVVQQAKWESAKAARSNPNSDRTKRPSTGVKNQ